MEAEYRRSIIYEKSMAFSVRIVRLYRHLSIEKREFVISKQLLRSGTAIGANISEAQFAISRNVFLNKMDISLKECAETLYWLDLLHRTDYLSSNQYDSIHSDCKELLRMLSSITKSTRDTPRNQ